MIDQNQLITKQQLEIENLKDKLREYINIFESISGALFNIGAPLNDNKLEFNANQRIYLKNKIANNLPTEDLFHD